MSNEEAIARAKKLKGLMPRMTDEQVLTVGRELLCNDIFRADLAIEIYARSAKDFVLSEFLSNLPTRAVGETPHERTKKMLNNEYRTESQLREYWEAADTAIDAMEPDELEAHRLAVLNQLPKELRPMYEKRDPRKSRPIKGLIFDRYRKSEAA